MFLQWGQDMGRGEILRSVMMTHSHIHKSSNSEHLEQI